MGENGYYQSFFKPENPGKCVNLQLVESFKVCPKDNVRMKSFGKPPYARSSYESRMFKWLDTNKNVLSWGSEVIQLDYINRNDKQLHKYWVDVYMVMKHSDGLVRKHIVEIKPKKKTLPPKPPKKKSRKAMFNYEMAMAEFVQNKSKWDAAIKWADSNGFVFSVVTEEELMTR